MAWRALLFPAPVPPVTGNPLDVSSQAPANPSVPAASPRPVFQAPKKLTSMGSIKALSTQTQAVQVPVTAGPEDVPVTAESFMKEWERQLEQVRTTHPSLHSILIAASPRWQEDGKILLQVSNQSSRTEVERHSADFLARLRAALRNRNMEFSFQLDANKETVAKPYAPNEKYAELVKLNPEIRNFKESLRLELEF